MDINVKNSISKQEYGVQNIKKKIANNKYEPEIAPKDIVYSKTYYNRQPGNVRVDETTTKIKAQEL